MTGKDVHSQTASYVCPTKKFLRLDYAASHLPAHARKRGAGGFPEDERAFHHGG
jgi:hypothetical protein